MSQLALLLHQAGRTPEAIAVLSQTEDRFRGIMAGSTSIPMLEAYRKLSSLSGLGTLYLEVGDPADAIRLFDELIGTADELQLAKTYPIPIYYPKADSLIRQAREGLDQAFQLTDKATLDATRERLLKPKDPKKTVDLLLVVNPREIDKATIRSLLAGCLESAGREPETLTQVKARLDELVKANPGDFEVQIARALADCQGGDPAAIASAAATLDRLTNETPLVALAPGTQATARQADEAARRLGLGLIARACWNHDSTFEIGDRLASKALDAARRQPDPAWTLAIVRERGQKALDKGDRNGAESRWESLLALILEDRLAKPSPTPAQAPAANPARPTPAGRPDRAAGRVRVPSVTVDKFRQAAEFARLAARNGMASPSLKAIRETLKAGPPVLPASMAAASPAVNIRTLTSAIIDAQPDPILLLVESMLIELDGLWDANQVPREAAYETLRDAVLPPARPADIFIYDPTMTRPGRAASAATTPDSQKPNPIARILARRAAEVGKLDELRDKVTARQNSPAATAAARSLLAAIEEARSKPKN
jgi:hypothetical protein